MKEALTHIQLQADSEIASIVAALNAATRNGGRRNFRDVKQATGISSSWLSYFADDKISDPGYKRVCLIKAWLKDKGFSNTPCNTEHRGVEMKRFDVAAGCTDVRCGS